MAKKAPAKKQLSKINSSLWGRSFSLAKFSLGAGAKMAAQTISQSLNSADQKKEKWQRFLGTQAQALTQELGELKGSLMKAGQMLSVYGEHFFPPEANQFLRALHQDSPPVSWDVMDKTLTKALGAKKRAELEVNPESVGTASLGQVHRAQIKKTGEWLALKIQYPNVDKAIDSDLRAIKSFLSIMKILPKDFNTDAIFHEIREMLLQETDYEQEANLTEEYARRLNQDPRFVIPKIYREYSNKKILASSFETGVRVDEPLIQNLSATRRNQLALHFLELYFKEVFEWHFVQTDPHFGNYRIRLGQNGEDQIVLFDFGATRRYPPEFMGPYRRLVKAMLENHKEDFETAARELKFLEENDSPELKKIFSEMCFDLVEPFLEPGDPRNLHELVRPDGTYDWKDTDLPQRSSKKVMKMLHNFKWRTPPKEIIFLDRKAAGVFVFLSHLRARIQGRDLLKKYLKG